MNPFDQKESPVSGVFLIATFLLVYLCLLVLWLSLGADSNSLKSSFISERESNNYLFSAVDSSAWNRLLSEDGKYFQPFMQFMSEKIADGSAIVAEKKGAIENMWRDSTNSLIIMGLWIDYRINSFLLWLPLAAIFFVSFIVDAMMVRKVGMYKNSFTSPTKHSLGGRVIGVPSGYLLIVLLFLPVNLPYFIFLGLISVNILGWWIWMANLPKRI
ncbi:MAG: DUF4400 domain-containing protein [Thiomicrospira sp.]|nr:DUF4400 domain-containing protein [Thiomicrospira sp.]NCN66307.1 DUF4400 domain-containing protein [Thiomicrospira sp.]NCO14760.1 DUF4400 domain-containing protein [Thiomicrospira sp.]NCO82357.1 DUF4400 domain-containing protein [Thiomicrospira sp.]OIP95176.1 MAG: hypothetical protein AUK56_06475 [Thiomicrospira sp. CG2_30_44_34]